MHHGIVFDYAESGTQASDIYQNYTNYNHKM